jgi:hypothetical protein
MNAILIRLKRNEPLQKNEETVNTYKGYPLFNDLEDFPLRSKNRGVIMANICEEHLNRERTKVSPKGLGLVLGYFNQIIPMERTAAKFALEACLTERGIKYA